MLLSGIIAITKSIGDSISHWKIPLWIFTSALFPPTVSSIFQFSMVFSMKFMTSPDILYTLRQSGIYGAEQYHMAFLYSILDRASMYSNSLVPLVHVQNPFRCSEKIPWFMSES